MLRMYVWCNLIWALINYNSVLRLSVCCLFPCRGFKLSFVQQQSRPYHSGLNWPALQPRKRAWRARSFAFSGRDFPLHTPNPKTRSLSSSPPQRARVCLWYSQLPPRFSSPRACHSYCYSCYCYYYSSNPAPGSTITATARYPLHSNQPPSPLHQSPLSISHQSLLPSPLPSSPWPPVSSDSRPLTLLLPPQKDESSLSHPRHSIQMMTAGTNYFQAARPRSLSILPTSEA